MSRNYHRRKSSCFWKRRGHVLIHGRWLVFFAALYWAFTRPPYYVQGSSTTFSYRGISPVKDGTEIDEPGVLLMARPEVAAVAATTRVSDGLDSSVISSSSGRNWVWVTTLFCWGSVPSLIFSIIGIIILVIYRCEAPECTFFPISILASTALLHSVQLINLIFFNYYFVFYDNNDWICKLLWFLMLYCSYAAILSVTAHGFHELFRDVFSGRKHMWIYIISVHGLSIFLTLAWVGYSESVTPDKCWQNPIKPAQIYCLLAPTSILVVLNLILNASSVCDALEADGVKSVGIVRLIRGVLLILLMLPYAGVETILYAFMWSFAKDDGIRKLHRLFNAVAGLVLVLRYCYLWEPIRRAIRRDCRRIFFRRAVRCQAKKRLEEGERRSKLECQNTLSETI